jgi:hypothetical protein
MINLQNCRRYGSERVGKFVVNYYTSKDGRVLVTQRLGKGGDVVEEDCTIL